MSHLDQNCFYDMSNMVHQFIILKWASDFQNTPNIIRLWNGPILISNMQDYVGFLNILRCVSLGGGGGGYILEIWTLVGF